MNQSSRKKTTLTMPGKFDILADRQNEERMSLGLVAVINQEERKLRSKLAKEQKGSGKEAEEK